jgi:hypothetical protein
MIGKLAFKYDAMVVISLAILYKIIPALVMNMFIKILLILALGGVVVHFYEFIFPN